MLGLTLTLLCGTLWVTGRCFSRVFSSSAVVFEMNSESKDYLRGRVGQVARNLSQFPAISGEMFGGVAENVAIREPSVKIQMHIPVRHRANDLNIHVEEIAAENSSWSENEWN